MYKNILIPVVFSDGHDTQASYLAAKALADEGAKFTVIHVMETVPGYAAGHIPAELLAKSRREVEKLLAQSAAALPGAKSALIEGNAGRRIVDYAAENGVDCIIMASHNPGLSNYLLGSTADRVVRHAKCAVHVIR
jgi:nucleotide-binding universal stress UspA family protein